jgi:amidase
MARTVSDAVILLGALTGEDQRDASTRESRGKALTDYTRFLDSKGLKGMRLGVARKYFGFNDRVDKLLTQRLDDLKRLGAILIDPADIPTERQVRRFRARGAVVRVQS